MKLTEYMSITLNEKTCLSVSRRRLCPKERGDPLEIDRGDPVSTETQKHRLGLCSTIKKSKFLQNAKQELVNTNFKQLEPGDSNGWNDNKGTVRWQGLEFIRQRLGATKASRNEQFGDSMQKEYDFLVMEMSTHEKIVRASDWCVPVKHVAKLNRMRGQTPTVKITSNDPFSRCKSVQEFGYR